MLDPLKKIYETAVSANAQNSRQAWHLVTHAASAAVSMRVAIRDLIKVQDDEEERSNSYYIGELTKALERLETIIDGSTPTEDLTSPINFMSEQVLEKIQEADELVQRAIREAHAAGKASAEPAYEVHNPNDESVRQKVWAITDGACIYCEAKLVPTGRAESSFVVEHVVPRAHGGPDNLMNYVPACKTCNMVKKSDHVVEFIRLRLPRRQAQQQAMLRLIGTDKNAAGGSD